MPSFRDGQPAAVRANLIDADFNYRRRYDPQRMASLRYRSTTWWASCRHSACGWKSTHRRRR